MHFAPQPVCVSTRFFSLVGLDSLFRIVVISWRILLSMSRISVAPYIIGARRLGIAINATFASLTRATTH